MNAKKCAHCGIEKPVTEFRRFFANSDGLSARCKLCAVILYSAVKDYQAAYQAKNIDKKREKQKEYSAKNREALREYGKTYYADNKETVAEYREKNKERQREYCRTYRAKKKAEKTA